MTEAMPFLRNTISLSYDTRSLPVVMFFSIFLSQSLVFLIQLRDKIEQ